MQIEIIDPDPAADVHLFNRISEQVFKEAQQDVEYINIIFVSRSDLRTLKNEYFGLDLYTDVITFNLNEEGDAIEGEIYLSFEQITENSKQFKTDLQDELHRVLIHGCLHLCGYEDESPIEKNEMTALEDFHLDRIKFELN